MDELANEIYLRLTTVCESNIKSQFITGIHANNYRMAFLEGVIATLGELKEVL